MRTLVPYREGVNYPSYIVGMRTGSLVWQAFGHDTTPRRHSLQSWEPQIFSLAPQNLAGKNCRVHFLARRALGDRRWVVLTLTVFALAVFDRAILAFAATISYDCPINSFTSIQGSASNRSRDTHL